MRNEIYDAIRFNYAFLIKLKNNVKNLNEKQFVEMLKDKNIDYNQKIFF